MTSLEVFSSSNSGSKFHGEITINTHLRIYAEKAPSYAWQKERFYSAWEPKEIKISAWEWHFKDCTAAAVCGGIVPYVQENYLEFFLINPKKVYATFNDGWCIIV